MKFLMIKRFSVAITFCLAVALTNPSPAIAAGKIQWTPREVEVTLGGDEGSSDTVLASFTSDIALDQITLEVVPALSALVTIDPNAIQSVEAGIPNLVSLHFSLPPGIEPGVYEGVVQVRSGRRTLPQTLKIKITVEAGENVLLGTDLPEINGTSAIISVQTVAQEFSLTSPITFSEIKLQMSGFGVDQFTVWVTNSVGPGTTQANVLFQTSATFPNTGGGINGATVSVPVNLSLPPGDYFIVLSSNQDSVFQGWLLATTTLPSTVGTVGGWIFSLPSDPLFPPASLFIPVGFSPGAFQIVE